MSMSRIVLSNEVIEEFLKELFKSNKKSDDPKEIMNSCVALICSFLNSHYGFELNVMHYFVTNYFDMCRNDELSETERLHLLFYAIQDKYEFVFNSIHVIIDEQYNFDGKNMNEIYKYVTNIYECESLNFKHRLSIFIKNIIIRDIILYHLSTKKEFECLKHYDVSVIYENNEYLNSDEYKVITNDDFMNIYNKINVYRDLFISKRNKEILKYVREKLNDINILNFELVDLEETRIYNFFRLKDFENVEIEYLKYLIVNQIMNITLIEFINIVFKNYNISNHFMRFIIIDILNIYKDYEFLNKHDLENIEQKILHFYD